MHTSKLLRHQVTSIQRAQTSTKAVAVQIPSLDPHDLQHLMESSFPKDTSTVKFS